MTKLGPKYEHWSKTKHRVPVPVDKTLMVPVPLFWYRYHPSKFSKNGGFSSLFPYFSTQTNSIINRHLKTTPNSSCNLYYTQNIFQYTSYTLYLTQTYFLFIAYTRPRVLLNPTSINLGFLSKPGTRTNMSILYITLRTQKHM